MNDDHAGRLAARIALAYDVETSLVQAACSHLPPLDASQVALERQGDGILVLHNGDTVAQIDLPGVLPPIAAGCDSLDPYGDRDDWLASASRRDPLASRIPLFDIV